MSAATSALAEHADSVRQVADHRQVVGDEQGATRTPPRRPAEGARQPGGQDVPRGIAPLIAPSPLPAVNVRIACPRPFERARRPCPIHMPPYQHPVPGCPPP